MGKGSSTRESFSYVEWPFSIDPPAIWGGPKHFACAPNPGARGRLTDTGQSSEASHSTIGATRKLFDRSLSGPSLFG